MSLEREEKLKSVTQIIREDEDREKASKFYIVFLLKLLVNNDYIYRDSLIQSGQTTKIKKNFKKD